MTLKLTNSLESCEHGYFSGPCRRCQEIAKKQLENPNESLCEYCGEPLCGKGGIYPNLCGPCAIL